MSLGFGGLQSGFQSLLSTIVNALQFTSSQASGQDAFKVQTNGARWHIGAGASDFLSSDGTTVSFAGPVSFTSATFNNNTVTVANAVNWACATGGGFSLAARFAVATAPTVAAGAGATMVNTNGSLAFLINLGGAAQTGTITLPTATNGWVVYMQDITTPASFVFGQTGGNTTTATFTCYSRTTGLAINWTANDQLACIAVSY